MTAKLSYAECSARERLAHIVDPNSFHEWLPPSQRLTSPHLAQLGVPSSFDDGVAIGRATLAGRDVFVAAQEGAFMGGGVGEVHGAKLVGTPRRALRDRPDAVLLLAESGGVRLHEANAGLIAVSEVMRALLDVRAAAIPVVVLIGGANGCFGGMGIVARCADQVVMSDIGRLAQCPAPRLSKPRTAWTSSIRAIARWFGARPAASIAGCGAATAIRWSKTMSSRSAPLRSRRSTPRHLLRSTHWRPSTPCSPGVCA